MSLVVTFNTVPISSGAFCQGSDQAIGSGEASDDVVLSSVASISVTAITVNLGSQRIAFNHGQTFPFTLSGGTPLACTIDTQNPPLISADPPLAGAPFGRIVIAYTEGEIQRTFTIDYAVHMIDATLDENDFPTESEYLDEWLWDMYAFGVAVRTPSNPLGLGWGLENPAGGGHLTWAQTYLQGYFDQGGVNVGTFMQFGQLFRVDNDPHEDFIEDDWIEAQEYGAANDYNHIWNTYEDALDWIIAEGGRPWHYTGTMRQSQNYLYLRNNPEQFCYRFLRSINFALRRDMGIIFDSPASVVVTSTNPHIDVGEQRYESLLLVQKFKTAQSLPTYVEPRTPALNLDLTEADQWYGAAGWAHFMQDRAYSRANPAWYSDASGSITNANMAPEPVCRWLVSFATNELLPFMLAEIFQRGQIAASLISHSWVNQGGTLTDLYGLVKHHIRVIRGVVGEFPLIDDFPATPDLPFEADPDVIVRS